MVPGGSETFLGKGTDMESIEIESDVKRGRQRE